MNYIWRLSTKFSTYLHLAAPTEDCETPITVTHNAYKNTIKDFNLGIYGGHIGDRPSPAAELIMAREDFDDDYFTWGGCMFVSERMRQVMALDFSEVRFFEVDASQSAPLPRSKSYQIMEPLVTEDVSDPENSEYDKESITPDNQFGPSQVECVAIRPDAAPVHDLFYDGFFASILLCTDQFAMRILKAGCTGVAFVDPRGTGEGRGVLYRTLRGVERFVGWDKLNYVDETELIQTI
jgi:hypothetical protein